MIVFKAPLLAALAGVLIRLRRPGSSAWIPVCVTALALFVMMPRLLLQPTVVSFLLLGLTLYLLQTPATSDAETLRRAARRRRFLPLVCLLWANLDGWFLLGPLTIGLYLVGEACQVLLPSGSEDEQPVGRGSLLALTGIFALQRRRLLAEPHLPGPSTAGCGLVCPGRSAGRVVG